MKNTVARTRRRLALLALGAALASGCATRAANPDDPLEGYNRAMFTFNERVDKAVMKPAAEVYETLTPLPLRVGVGNFFGNFGDIWNGVNNLLQGKFRAGLSDAGRFGLNSTVGILGLFDVATDVGLAKSDEDFGQTLGWWGVGEGAYFVVPFFGPRTVRDAAVLPIDLIGDSVWGIDHVATRNTMTAVRLVNARANLLGIDKTLEEGTLDKYAYARDFYLQQRRYKVYDGNPPSEYEDFDGDEAALPAGFATDVAARSALADLQLVAAPSRLDRSLISNR